MVWKAPSSSDIDAHRAIDPERTFQIKAEFFRFRWWIVAGDTVIKGNESRPYLEGYLEGMPEGDRTMPIEIIDSYALTGRKGDWNYR